MLAAHTNRKGASVAGQLHAKGVSLSGQGRAAAQVAGPAFSTRSMWFKSNGSVSARDGLGLSRAAVQRSSPAGRHWCRSRLSRVLSGRSCFKRAANFTDLCEVCRAAVQGPAIWGLPLGPDRRAVAGVQATQDLHSSVREQGRGAAGWLSKVPVRATSELTKATGQLMRVTAQPTR